MDEELRSFRRERIHQLWHQMRWPVAIVAWSITALLVASIAVPSARQYVGGEWVWIDPIFTTNVRVAVMVQIISVASTVVGAMVGLHKALMWQTGMDGEQRRRIVMLNCAGIRASAKACWKLKLEWNKEKKNHSTRSRAAKSPTRKR